jgi:hypothetical protein
MSATALQALPRQAGDELDLHGIVGLRLVDAPPGAVERLRAQLAPLEPGLAREPDVVIRYVDRIETSGPLRAIGLDDAWFSDDGFLLGLPGSRGRALVPLDAIGGPCEIVCERTLSEVPLLRPILLLTALGRGHAPAHASAVDHRGRGILTTGWTSGGKTGVQLSLMALGCRFVSDDVVLIGRNGRMHGVHEPISIKDYYLDEAEAVRRNVAPQALRRIRAVALLEAIARGLPRGFVRRLTSGRARRRLEKWARAQRTVKESPQRLFGAARCLESSPLSTVLLTESCDDPAVSLSPLDPHEAARRMAVSSRDELAVLDEAYRKFRFAFPERRNPHLESAERRLEETLVAALTGGTSAPACRAYRVSHPYPASIRDLTSALQSLCPPEETS